MGGRLEGTPMQGTPNLSHVSGISPRDPGSSSPYNLPGNSAQVLEILQAVSLNVTFVVTSRDFALPRPG